MKYNNGFKYEGYWKDNHIEGKGILKNNNGEIYEGEFEKGILKNGVIKFESEHKKDIEIENGKFKKENIKVLFIGDSSVGKSSIIKIIENPFYDNINYEENEEIIKINDVNLEMLEINLNKIPENFSFENINIILLIYDITNKNSFNKIKSFFYEKIEGQERYCIILGNKNDLFNKIEISELDGDKFSKSINSNIIEINTLNKEKIIMMFQKLLTDYYKKKEEGVLFYEEECYCGELNNLKKEGFGILINYKNQSIYSGNWDNNLKNERGILYKNEHFMEGKWGNDIFIEGKIYAGNVNYEGDYLENKLNGTIKFYNLIFMTMSRDKFVCLILKNENIIEGDAFQNGNGDGIIKYKNGKKFIGHLEKFKRDGKGIMINKNNNNYFISEWKKDELLNNEGILILENGDIYKGEFNTNYKEEEEKEFEENIKNFNIEQKITYIKDNFPKDLKQLNSLTIFDEEIMKKELGKQKINDIWKLGKENEDSFSNKIEELESLEEKYTLEELSKDNEVINNIDELFNYTNMLRKYIIFNIKKIINNFHLKDFQYLNKNFEDFYEISYFEGKLNENAEDYKYKEGKGIMEYENGDKYDGEWVNDIKEGNGIMKYNNGDLYVGEWANDMKIGNGIMKYENGDKYDGEWANDIKEGKGKMKYENGDKYDGDWINDKKEGKGEMKYENGDKYIGDWINDKKEGNGKMEYENGDKYIGEWINDKKEGNGRMEYINGDEYDGQWKENLREGIGIMKYKNGEEYKGGWKKDIREGKGILRYKNEIIAEGIWKKDDLLRDNSLIFEKTYFTIKKCEIKEHNNNSIIGYCIDPACTNNNRLLCIDCIFNLHNQHKIKKIEEINESIISQLNLKISNNNNFNEKIKNKFENLRALIDEKEQLFFEEKEKFLKDNKEKINKEYIKQNIPNIKEILEKDEENIDYEYDFENIKYNILNSFPEKPKFKLIYNPLINEIINNNKKKYEDEKKRNEN